MSRQCDRAILWSISKLGQYYLYILTCATLNYTDKPLFVEDLSGKLVRGPYIQSCFPFLSEDGTIPHTLQVLPLVFGQRMDIVNIFYYMI